MYQFSTKNVQILVFHVKFLHQTEFFCPRRLCCIWGMESLHILRMHVHYPLYYSNAVMLQYTTSRKWTDTCMKGLWSKSLIRHSATRSFTALLHSWNNILDFQVWSIWSSCNLKGRCLRNLWSAESWWRVSRNLQRILCLVCVKRRRH